MNKARIAAVLYVTAVLVVATISYYYADSWVSALLYPLTIPTSFLVAVYSIMFYYSATPNADWTPNIGETLLMWFIIAIIQVTLVRIPIWLVRRLKQQDNHGSRG